MDRKEYFSRVRKALSDLVLSFNSLSTDKAELFWNEDTELMVGYDVYIDGVDGKVIAPDGEYISDDNKIKVEGGKVIEIEAKSAEDVAEDVVKEEILMEEVTEIIEPKDEKDIKIEELEAKIKELEDVIIAKDAEIEELKAKLEVPAAEPVTEVFNTVTKITSVDKNTDKWVKIAQSISK